MITKLVMSELCKTINQHGSSMVPEKRATSVTARASMARVRALFPEQVIARCGGIACPPSSPNLFMCDFSLWGHLKANVTKKSNVLWKN